MEEKRKHKRLDLYVHVQLERLDEEGVTTLKYVQAECRYLLQYEDSDLDQGSR